MNGQMDYYSVSFAQAHLQQTTSSGKTAAAQNLQQAITTSDPVLDFELAYYLAAFNVSTFNNTVIKDYIVNYRNVLHYEMEAESIAAAATWLYSYGLLSEKEMLSLLSRLYSDPNVSTGSKLYIEDIQYEFNAL